MVAWPDTYLQMAWVLRDSHGQVCVRICVGVACHAFVLVYLAVPPGESLVACARVALDGIETAPADSTRVGGTIIVVMGGGGGRYNRTTICARSDSPVNQVCR